MLDKQELKEKALAAEKQTVLDNIREINDAELEAYKKTNQKKLELLKENQAAQLEAAAAGSGDGKGFRELIAEGKTYADIVRMLDEYAQQTGVTLNDMFGSSEAAKAALGVTGSNADKWDSNLSAMSAEEDVVGDAYEKVTATTQEKFNGILNTLKNAAIEVFDSIKVKIGELFSEENMAKLNKLITPLKELVEKVLPPILDIVLMLVDPLAELAEQLLPIIETAVMTIADVMELLAEPLTDIIENVLPVLADLLMGTDYLYTHNYWVNVRSGRTGTIDVLNNTSDGYKGCPAYIRPHWDSFRTQVEKYLDFKAEKDVLYRVQVGAFHNKSNAEIYLKSVQKYFPGAFITKEG